MVFTVWLNEFCILHTKLQMVSKILEEHLVLDTINNIKKFMIPVRTMHIENFEDENDYKTRAWYENGQIKYEHNYKNDRRHGIFRGWYQIGQIRFEENFKNGERHGICKEWYPNGQIYCEEIYKNGKKHGISRELHRNGDLSYEHNYEHGKRL